MSFIGESLRDELVRAYEAADRHYHDLRHIEALLALARDQPLLDSAAVEAAIWFHDAIYDTRRNDNEERSAKLAVARLTGVASPDRIARISTMIRATAGHRLPAFSEPREAADCALFLDMDLAILGSSAADFAAYERDVRREYAFVPEAAWRSGRRRVLADFLARPTIYLDAAFRAGHEVRARQNLAHAIARIDSAKPEPASRGP